MSLKENLDKNKYKGFSLIELAIALGLSALIVCLVISFFTVNFKSYKKINNDVELQFQAQQILNFMSGKILISSNIASIKKGTDEYINEEFERKISKISFKNGLNTNEYFNFELKYNSIYYIKGNSINIIPTVEVGNFVHEITVKPYPNGATFKECKAVNIFLYLIKEKQEYKVEQLILMRNN